MRPRPPRGPCLPLCTSGQGPEPAVDTQPSQTTGQSPGVQSSAEGCGLYVCGGLHPNIMHRTSGQGWGGLVPGQARKTPKRARHPLAEASHGPSVHPPLGIWGTQGWVRPGKTVGAGSLPKATSPPLQAGCRVSLPFQIPSTTLGPALAPSQTLRQGES